MRATGVYVNKQSTPQILGKLLDFIEQLGIKTAGWEYMDETLSDSAAGETYLYNYTKRMNEL